MQVLYRADASAHHRVRSGPYGRALTVRPCGQVLTLRPYRCKKVHRCRALQVVCAERERADAGRVRREREQMQGARGGRYAGCVQSRCRSGAEQMQVGCRADAGHKGVADAGRVQRALTFFDGRALKGKKDAPPLILIRGKGHANCLFEF